MIEVNGDYQISEWFSDNPADVRRHRAETLDPELKSRRRKSRGKQVVIPHGWPEPMPLHTDHM